MFYSSLDFAKKFLQAHPQWFIFPITRYQKFPPCFENNLALASNDPKQIEAWHKKWIGCNWGLSLAKSRVIVVDVDEKPGKHGLSTYLDLDLDHGFDATLSVITPSGGHHYYYQIPTDDKEHKHRLALGKNGFGRDVDVPNYVLIPGCTIFEKSSTGDYVIERDIDVAPTPTWFWDFIKEKQAPTQPQAVDVVLDADPNIKWFIDYLKFDAAPSIEGCGGEKALLDVFGVAKDRGISIEHAVELVDEFYNVSPMCDPIWANGEGPDADRLDIKARNAYAYLTENAPGERTPEFEFADELPELTAADIALSHKMRMEKAGELPPLDDPTGDRGLRVAPVSDPKTPQQEPAKNPKIDVDWVVANWVWVIGAERFIRRKDGLMWNRKQFDSRFNFLGRSSSISGELFKTKGRIRRFHALKYVPGGEEVMGDDYNLWRASSIEPEAGNTDLWNEHINYLFQNDDDRNAVLNWLAWVYQHQELKPNHALLIVGYNTGTGKSFVARVMEKLIGRANTQRPKNSSLKGDFNGWAMNCKLCIIEELMQIGRREVANELRDIITEPHVEVNIKNVPAFQIDNYMAMMAVSNHPDAMPLDETDRRWLVIETHASRRAIEYYEKLLAMLENPVALAAIAHELSRRDVGTYNALASAPETDAKARMVTLSRSDVETWLHDNSGNPPLSCSVTSIQDIVDAMPATLQRTARLSSTTIPLFLTRQLRGEKLGQYRFGSRRMYLWALNGKAMLVKQGDPGAIYERERKNDQRDADAEAQDDFGV